MKRTINITIFILFLSLYFFDGFLGVGLKDYGLHLIPSKFSWVCEISSSIIAIYCFIVLSFTKRISISPSYLLFFVFFTLYLSAGIIVNTVPSGAIFAGIRRYFIFFPLFFLPTVYDFSESEIRIQLKILLLFGFIQIPFSIYQRFFLYKEFATGDLVTGTLLASTDLTINQLFCIAILTAIYIKKRIKFSSFIIIMVLLFIPTTINETKATLFLLPIAISIPIMLGTPNIFKFKKVFMVCTLGIIAISLFIPLYSYLYKTSVLDFFDMSGEDRGDHAIKGYLYKGLSQYDISEEPGRIDALLFPFRILHKKPLNLLLGLGMGNVNTSGIAKFKGEHTEYDKLGANSISVASMIWEIGLLGLSLYFIFFYMVLKDSFKLRSANDIFGAIGIGWIAVIIMLYLCLFYANILHMKAIGYLFYYFSGIIVSKARKMANAQ